MCVFVYAVDTKTEPAREREPMAFTEVYLGPDSIRRFSQKSARRTRNKNRNAPSARHREVAPKLDL